jgi:Ca2+-binding RTX toxin-like protein
VIAGLAGDDLISGGLGHDVICGGPGADRVAGQGDDDRLFGEQGPDLLDGGEGGCCYVPTNTGDDVLFGGTQDDVLHTSDFSTAASTLHGGEGNDELNIWSGASYGDEGDDRLNQYSRDSVLDGGEGNDVLVDMNDFGLANELITLLGGLGDDTLRSEDATSVSALDGGSGVDSCAGGDVTGACEA